jgi:hypothetical protein
VVSTLTIETVIYYMGVVHVHLHQGLFVGAVRIIGSVGGRHIRSKLPDLVVTIGKGDVVGRNVQRDVITLVTLCGLLDVLLSLHLYHIGWPTYTADASFDVLRQTWHSVVVVTTVT